MTTKTATLTEFLLARIAEREQYARTFLNVNRLGNWQPGMPHAAVLLAECAAKRAIVDLVEGSASCLLEDDPDDPIEWNGEVHQAAAVLRALAAPYDDHPEFRPEWA